MKFSLSAAAARFCILAALALPAASAAPCSSYAHHGIATGMTHKEVWDLMGERGRQREVADPGGAQHSVSEFDRNGALIEVEYDSAITRRHQATVVAVETRFSERSVDAEGLLKALVDELGPPVDAASYNESGLSAGTARWVDPACGVEVSASRKVPEWWEPGQGPTIRVRVRATEPAPGLFAQADEPSPPPPATRLSTPAATPPDTEERASLRPGRAAEGAPPPVRPPAPFRRPAVDPTATPSFRAPVAIESPPPIYPTAARTRRHGGRVVLSVLVDDQGNVEDVAAVKSGGVSRLLQDAAVRAVREWRYEPALQDGNPVSVWTTVAIAFEP